ncbi:hypothetical protein JW960_01320 [candidate division KSB1 bacterium]|nr:hypothetical protein [candidate division KSB1 bacterium]
MSEKVRCETPTPGKQPTNIDRWKYETVRQAIFDVLAAHSDNVLFQDLPHLVAAQLSPEQITRLGSVSWYTTTVKLDMEVRGEITRIPNANPQRLQRATHFQSA